MKVTVTGGAGYIGASATRELLTAGHEVSVLDSLLHGQEAVASALEGAGARVIRGDVRDADARAAALAELEAAECRYAQGFHFARPMPAREVSALLAAGRRL
jgi:nucleoside-diphosphate-sugar epimerase